MMKWNAWMGELAQKGKMLSGEPLDAPGKTLSGKDRPCCGENCWRTTPRISG